MGARTPDPLLAKQVLSQLSYRPITITNVVLDTRTGTITGANAVTIPVPGRNTSSVFVDGGRTGTRTWDLHLIRMAL